VAIEFAQTGDRIVRRRGLSLFANVILRFIHRDLHNEEQLRFDSGQFELDSGTEGP
jgi:hypothetical protein